MSQTRYTGELSEPGIRQGKEAGGSFSINHLRRSGALEVRRGFGQVAEFDTSLRNISTTSATETFGYTRHLCSKVIRTRFGRTQVVSILLANVRTSSAFEKGLTVEGYCVSIFDLETGDRYEELLYRRTSQFGGDMERQHGCYATGLTNKADQTVRARVEHEETFLPARNPSAWCFAELNGVLYMGHPDVGVWAYFPCTFRGSRDESYPRFEPASTDGVHRREAKGAFEESCVLFPLVGRNGIGYPAYTYLLTGEMPRPQAMATHNGRMVYAVGNELIFSDAGFPQEVIALNRFSLETTEPITAMASVRGILYVWTANTMWRFEQYQGPRVTGDMRNVSMTVGCLGPAAVAHTDEGVAWVSRTGIYGAAGGLAVAELSANIRPFFGSGLRDPWSKAADKNLSAGDPADLSGEHDMSSSWWLLSGDATVTYHPEWKAVIASFPEDEVSFVFQEGEWSLWMLSAQVAKDGGFYRPWKTTWVNKPWLEYAGDGRLLAISGIEEDTLSDTSLQTTSRSYQVLEYGRGGGVDRTCVDEDYREGLGWWKDLGVVDSDFGFYFGRPQKCPPGYSLLNGSSYDDLFLVPVYLVLPEATWASNTAMTLDFLFENTHWTPVVMTSGSTSSAEIHALFPPERMASAQAGYGVGAPSAGSQIRVFNLAGSAEDPAGPRIIINWDGTLGTWGSHPGTHPWKPNMNHARGSRAPLFWLPFQLKSGLNIEAQMGLHITVNTARASGANQNVFTWEESVPYDASAAADAKASPVPHLFVSERAGPRDFWQHEARGVRIDAQTSGPADSRILDGTMGKMLFVVLAAEDQLWHATEPSYRREPAEVEIQQGGGDVLQTFGEDGAGDLVLPKFGDANMTWGNVSNLNTGNVISRDYDHVLLHTSSGIKGEWWQVMVGGHISNVAEFLKLMSVRVKMQSHIGAMRTFRPEAFPDNNVIPKT